MNTPTSFAIFIELVLGLAVILFIVKLYNDHELERKRRMMLPPVPLNFETDLMFLNFIIDHKLKQTKLFLLEPARLSGTAIVNDNEFNGHIDNIVADILELLSPNYKRTMYKYFTESSLTVYITEIVYRELTAIVLQVNMKQIKKS